MTIAVDLGRKATKQTKQTVCQSLHLGLFRLQRVKGPIMTAADDKNSVISHFHRK